MARPRSTTLTEGEQRIMEVLWALGEASVQDVTDALAKREPVAYTTALTVLRILHAKHYVEYRKQGKAHVFVPIVSRDAVRTTAVQQLLRRFFDGSPEALAQHLVASSKVEARDLERLGAQVRAAKARAKRGPR